VNAASRPGPSAALGRQPPSRPTLPPCPTRSTPFWSSGALLGIRCAAWDHRAVLSATELSTIRRGNATRLRDLRLRCGHCGERGQAPEQFTLYMPEDVDEADGFMRGKDVTTAVV